MFIFHMRHQTRFLITCVTTIRARKRFFSSVNRNMSFDVVSRVHNLFAVRTTPCSNSKFDWKFLQNGIKEMYVMNFYQSTMDLFSRSMFRSNVSLKTKVPVTRKVTKLTNKVLFSSMSNNMIQMCSSGCGHFWTIWTNPRRSWAKFNRKILEISRMKNYQKFWKK